MKRQYLIATTLLPLLTSPLFAANYFVQPIVDINPGEFINGYQADGPTSSHQGFNNAPTSINSDVDLTDGTIRGNVDFGTATGLGGFSQGRFGEQVTFHNGANTNWNFVFSFDGDVKADARDPNLNSTLQISVDAYIAIFDSTTGATSASWYDLSVGATPGNDMSLFNDRKTYDYTNPTEDLDDFLNDSISGSLLIPSGPQSFDIFANLTLVISKNDNPVNASLNFQNTAQFSINTNPGVTYTSLSGQFLDSTGITPTPEPASLSLLASLLPLTLTLRRRKTHP